MSFPTPPRLMRTGGMGSASGLSLHNFSAQAPTMSVQSDTVMCRPKSSRNPRTER